MLLIAPSVDAFSKSTRSIVIVGPVIRGFEAKTNELIKMVKESKEPINITLNSPGGSVWHGLNFVKVMRSAKAQGIKIRCMVTGMAASMAFIIFNECSERYAFRTSLLLWHPVRTQYMGILTAKYARLIAYDLEQFDKIVMPDLKKSLRLPKGVFETHADNDLFMPAELLNGYNTKYLNIVTAYRGKYGF